MERNNERVNAVWKPLCIVFAALLALSWVFFGFLYSNGNVSFSTLETPEQSYTADNGGAIIGESTGNGIALMSAEIPVEEFAANDISSLAESAYTLTATITPDNADDKTVDWSVAFVNPSSSWASGKTVSDYVTVTPTSDGALTANVECLQALGEQIKVVVASRIYPSAKAECTVDYRRRITSIEFQYSDSSGGSQTFFSSDTSVVIDAAELKFDRVTLNYTDYTVTDSFSGTYTFSGTDEMAAEIRKSEALSGVRTFSCSVGDRLLNRGILNTVLNFSGFVWVSVARPTNGFYTYDNASSNPSLAFSAYEFIRESCETVPFATMTCTYRSSYSTFSFEIDLFTKADWWVVST